MRRCALIGALVGAVACAGCRESTELSQEEAEKKLAEKGQAPKDPFQLETINVRPSETERIEPGIKPGHWTSASLPARSNLADFRGEIVTSIVDAEGGLTDLDGLPFRLQSIRPVELPKEQKRELEVTLFAPVDSANRHVAGRLASRSGREIFAARDTVVRLPAHQYYFVILAREPESYRYVQSLDSIRAPAGDLTERGPQAHYRVLLPLVKTDVPLPSHASHWTMIAYVLWDEVLPDSLNADQRQALVDWLHWGGQLIVGSPDTLETLRGSFLDPYLPVSAGDKWEIGAEQISQLNQEWKIGPRDLTIVKPWTGRKLVPRGASSQRTLVSDPSGEPLLVERQVGLGRIVVPAFRLTQRELVNWPNFDGFFNACILRRGPRRFAESDALGLKVDWVEGNRYDPARTSRLRYFSRDAGAATAREPTAEELNQQRYQWNQRPNGFSGFPQYGGDPLAMDEPPAGPGVAAWNDRSAAAQEARRTLREAARIEVPKATFVLAVLAGYIAVLVPLNWFVFWRLGRVELAWAAAPLVSIAFGGLVIWLAQLNIGFARSATEVALVEIQPGYARAHVARYVALYSSLSTQYDVTIEDPSAATLPFAANLEAEIPRGRSTVILRRTPLAEVPADGREAVAVSLEDFEVASNSTGMVHAEQMLPLEGTLQLEELAPQRYRLRNKTQFDLHDAQVVRDSRTAWLGALPPGGEVVFELAFGQPSQQSASSGTASDSRGPELTSSSVVNLAKATAAAGELRLIARIADEVAGLAIDPAPAQHRSVAVLVAHLAYGLEPPPVRDANTRAQIQKLLRNPSSADAAEPAEETNAAPAEASPPPTP